ncbi:MAG: rhodanese-like domain-containing protein [Gammaproteobacteria bacterium]|nr:rhodanese-like domain-containing protein [Gammaproteobacteria bacterium]
MIRLSSKIFLLLALLFFYRLSIADDYLSPESIEGSTTIDAESLIELAHEHDDLIVIDSRIKSDRRQGYIAGSISLPDTETDCTSLLPLIKENTPTVFYCNGPKCRRSDRAVVIAKECGYTDLYWFRGGFEEWQNKQYLISK